MRQHLPSRCSKTGILSGGNSSRKAMNDGQRSASFDSGNPSHNLQRRTKLGLSDVPQRSDAADWLLTISIHMFAVEPTTRSMMGNIRCPFLPAGEFAGDQRVLGAVRSAIG